jgi:hypothetical protein
MGDADGVPQQSSSAGLEPPQKNLLQILPLGNSELLAEFLISGDIYLVPEPASSNLNSILNTVGVKEALVYGLSVLYPEGIRYDELVGDAGLGLNRLMNYCQGWNGW